MCGEMAGDPRYTRLLLGMGLTDFSVHPAGLLDIKEVIHQCQAGRFEPVVADIIASDAPDRITELLNILNEM
jgi:phosphotransferase system enzyme I (PtsI)